MSSNEKYAGQVRVDGKYGGTKLDGAKPQYGLVPPDALKAVAEVMTEGAKKYSANNWVSLELSRVLDALERHIHDFKMGEDLAFDTQQHHMAHAIANAMMAYHIATKRPLQDDRLFKNILGDDSVEVESVCHECEKTDSVEVESVCHECEKTDSVEEQYAFVSSGNISKAFLDYYKNSLPELLDSYKEILIENTKKTKASPSSIRDEIFSPEVIVEQIPKASAPGPSYSYTSDKGNPVTLPARAKRRHDALKKIFAEGSTPERREALERVAQAFARAEGTNISSHLTKDDLILKNNGYWRVL